MEGASEPACLPACKRRGPVGVAGGEVLRCIALRCVALHCVALRCVVLPSIALRCVAMHCIALRCAVLCCVAVRCGAVLEADLDSPHLSEGKYGWIQLSVPIERPPRLGRSTGAGSTPRACSLTAGECPAAHLRHRRLRRSAKLRVRMRQGTRCPRSTGARSTPA